MKKDTIIKMAQSFARVFCFVILAFVLEHKSIFGIDWMKAIDAASVAGIAVIYNFFNPSYTMYGPDDKTKQDEEPS
jgi:hypothetical protein